MNKFFYCYNFFFKKDVVTQFRFKDEFLLPFFEKIIFQISFKKFFFKAFHLSAFFCFILEFLLVQKVSFNFSSMDLSFWFLRKKNLVSLFLSTRGKNLFFFLEKFFFFFFLKKKILGLKNLRLFLFQLFFFQ